MFYNVTACAMLVLFSCFNILLVCLVYHAKKGILYYLFYNIIIVQVRYITIETREVTRT